MPALPVTARDLTVSYGPHLVLDSRVAPSPRPATGSASSARTAPARPPCCGPSPGSSRPTRARSPPRRPLPRSATSPRCPSASAGEAVRASLARRTGVAAASEELHAATAALARSEPGADDRYTLGARPMARPRRRRPRRQGRRGVGRPRPRRPPARPADGLAQRRRGGPGPAGRRPALPLRRPAARRADQRPRLRRPRPPRGASSTGLDVPLVAREPRPRLPRADHHRGAGARRALPPGRPASRAAGPLTSTSGPPPVATPRRPTTSLHRHPRRAPGPDAAPAPVVQDRRGEGEEEPQGPRQGPAEVLRGQRPRSRPSKVRQSEKALARLDAVDKPWEPWDLRLEIAAAPTVGLGRRPARGGGGPPRRLRARPGRRRGRLGRPGRHPRAQRLGEVDAARRAARPAAARRGDAATSGPGVVVGEIDQGRGLLDTERPLARRVRGGSGLGQGRRRGHRGPHPPGQVRPRRRPRRPPGVVAVARASAPGRPSPCSRPGAPTAWCSTSPPTTSTCRPSSSSSRRSRRSRAPCCSSPTTASCSTPITVNRTLRLEQGRLSES